MASHDRNDSSAPIRPSTSLSSRGSTASRAPSLQSPRVARFAEATSVESPIEPTRSGRSPFADPEPVPTTHYLMPQPQVSDVGFGYIGGHEPSNRESGVEMPITPRSPLKSALKSPGAPPRMIDNNINPLSPTFKETPLSPTVREERSLKRAEKKTTKQQAKDLKIKIRVRMAKLMLRGTNFACSLIVLSMLAATFSIFNATKHLPARNNLPPWAATTNPWPQITLLVIACISLAMSIVIFYAYFRGGHRRAEKLAVYYTVFAVGFFMFSIIMWAVGAAILQHSKNTSKGQDIWGWSCKDNARKANFQGSVDYDVVCRLQNWSLVCALIEIIVEVITIAIYAVVFYRFYTKRRLTKSMAMRDNARSDLYLAQLRSQSAPNTPGLGPLSPREGGYNPLFSPRFAPQNQNIPPEKSPLTATHPVGSPDDFDVEEAAGNVRYIDAAPEKPLPKKPFTLQAPPTRHTPKTAQKSTFETQQTVGGTPPLPQQSFEVSSGHVPAAPGEQQYAAVPIPGAYASPIASPTYPVHTSQPNGGFGYFPQGPASNAR